MTTNINPMQLISIAKKSQNPKQFVYNIVEENMGNNPLFANLLNLAKTNNTSEIETVARNIFKEKGLDFDKEFNTFKQNFGL